MWVAMVVEASLGFVGVDLGVVMVVVDGLGFTIGSSSLVAILGCCFRWGFR